VRAKCNRHLNFNHALLAFYMTALHVMHGKHSTKPSTSETTCSAPGAHTHVYETVKYGLYYSSCARVPPRNFLHAQTYCKNRDGDARMTFMKTCACHKARVSAEAALFSKLFNPPSAISTQKYIFVVGKKISNHKS
jgi:hypothetical protein